jgi:hypothetical protein
VKPVAMGTTTPEAKKRKRTPEQETEELAAQEAEAVALQDDFDEEWAREVEHSVARRGTSMEASPLPYRRREQSQVGGMGTRYMQEKKNDKGKGKARQM